MPTKEPRVSTSGPTDHEDDQSCNGEGQVCERKNIVEPLHLRPDKGRPLVRGFVKESLSIRGVRAAPSESGFHPDAIQVAPKFERSRAVTLTFTTPPPGEAGKQQDERSEEVDHVINSYDHRGIRDCARGP